MRRRGWLKILTFTPALTVVPVPGPLTIPALPSTEPTLLRGPVDTMVYQTDASGLLTLPNGARVTHITAWNSADEARLVRVRRGRKALTHIYVGGASGLHVPITWGLTGPLVLESDGPGINLAAVYTAV